MDAIIEALTGFMWDVIRNILWFLDKFILQIVDYLYSIIQTFFGLKITSFSFIWDIYAVVCAALAVFTLFRIFALLFQSLWDDEGFSRLSSSTIVRRVMGMLLLMSLIPVGLPILSEAFAGAATAAPAIFTTEDIQPSNVIISAGMADFSGSLNNENVLDIPEGESAIDFISDINLKNTNGEYVYIQDTSNLLLILIVAAISAYCFIFISIQIIQRFIGILQKIVLAPMAVSGIVDPSSTSAQTWAKLLMSDFLTNFFQILFIWISLLFATNLPTGFNGLAKGLAFVGALFAIMVAPSGIAQLLGSDPGATAGMQMMQHVQTMGTLATAAATTSMALGGAAKGIASMAGGKMMDTTAGSIYSLGRKMGGRNLDPGSSNGSGSTDTPPVLPNGPEDSGTTANGSSSKEHDMFTTGLYGTSGGFGAGEFINSSTGSDSNSEMESANYSPYTDFSQDPLSATGVAQNSPSNQYSSYVGNDGILHYSDNRVSEPGSFAGSFTDYKKNPFQGMAGYAAGRLYQRSAQRIFTTKQQRAALKQNITPMQKAEERRDRRKSFARAVFSPSEASKDFVTRKVSGDKNASISGSKEL